MNDSTDPEAVEEIAISADSALATAFQARTEALLTELSQAGERRYRYNKHWRILLKASALYWCGFQILRWINPPLTAVSHLAWRVLAYIAILALVPMLIKLTGTDLLFWVLTTKKRTHFEIVMKELSADSRAVGAIAQFCTRSESLGSSDMGVKILIDMLPRVKAHDARYISDSQMEALLALLDLRNQEGLPSTRSKELPLAILKALEHIGDSRALEPVRRLTQGGLNRRYHQAAKECLSILEQHGEERDHNRFLLLPSSAENSQEMLLRPVTAQVETQPELLLRATMPQAEMQPELLLRAVVDEERG